MSCVLNSGEDTGQNAHVGYLQDHLAHQAQTACDEIQWFMVYL